MGISWGAEGHQASPGTEEIQGPDHVRHDVQRGTEQNSTWHRRFSKDENLTMSGMRFALHLERGSRERAQALSRIPTGTRNVQRMEPTASWARSTLHLERGERICPPATGEAQTVMVLSWRVTWHPRSVIQSAWASALQTCCGNAARVSGGVCDFHGQRDRVAKVMD